MGYILNYFDELSKAMTELSKNEKTIFLGQSCEYPGHALYKTLKDVPMNKRIEMPVAEDMQMGISLGLALNGDIPISIFPRHDFVICGMNQLVNHIDKIPAHAKKECHMIIRTAIGATKPLYPGVQHCQNYTNEFKSIFHNIEVVELLTAEEVVPKFLKMLSNPGIYLTVESMNMYND